MKFLPTSLDGAWIVEVEPRGDERGFFARTWCQREAANVGLCPRWVQANTSLTRDAGTLRGMHYQASPWQEAKLVRCTRGAIFDVIVDLRPFSQTYLRWFGAELSAENLRALYVPEDFAHGFLTLTADVEMQYLMSQFYTPQAQCGLRWNDPAVGIRWPRQPSVISDRDARWPDVKGAGR
ncbi:MAG: dTDP-4-dehydrorhamnose 3,5-epimerase [Phycisphaerae bacterium]